MSISAPVLVTIFLIGLFFSGFFSMLEAAVISQDRHRLRYLTESDNKNARIMHQLLFEDTERVLAAILLCNNLANVTCATAATALAASFTGHTEITLLFVTLVVTLIILVFSEITPKVVGVRHASTIAIFCARPLRLLLRLLSPFVAVANCLSSALLVLVGIHKRPKLQTVMNIGELRAAVRAASRTATDSLPYYQMVEKTLSFRGIAVEKIMTPRRDMVGINLKDSPTAIADAINAASFAKLALYEDSLDDIKGTVDTIQALKLINRHELSANTLLAVAHAPLYVPAAANAMQQMQRMREADQRIAYVSDGTGSIIGMLTFTNFAAAIIGENKLPEDAKHQDGVWEVPASLPLLQLEQLVPSPSPLPDNISAITLNGLVLEHLGDVPKTPVCATIHGWRIEITDWDDKSVLRLRIHPSLPEPHHNDD